MARSKPRVRKYSPEAMELRALTPGSSTYRDVSTDGDIKARKQRRVRGLQADDVRRALAVNAEIARYRARKEGRR